MNQTMIPTTTFRIIRDDNILGAFSGDFRKPDRLQQCFLTPAGRQEWHDVQVIPASELSADAASPRSEGEKK